MIKQAQLVRELGVSRSLISKYVARGCPLGSMPDALAWIRAHIWRRKITLAPSATTPAAPDDDDDAGTNLGEQPDNDNPYEALRAAKQIERQTFTHLRAMRREEDQATIDRAFRSFFRAQRHTFWMRAEVRSWQRQQGVTLGLDEAKLFYGKGLSELWRLVRVAPKTLSIRCSSPQMAETAMTEYVARIVKTIDGGPATQLHAPSPEHRGEGSGRSEDGSAGHGKS
jgi:uncharacterized membrane protein